MSFRGVLIFLVIIVRIQGIILVINAHRVFDSDDEYSGIKHICGSIVVQSYLENRQLGGVWLFFVGFLGMSDCKSRYV